MKKVELWLSMVPPVPCYAQQNKYINRAFMRRVLSLEDGKPITIGEAHRLAQNDVVTGAMRTTGRRCDRYGKPSAVFPLGRPCPLAQSAYA